VTLFQAVHQGLSPLTLRGENIGTQREMEEIE